MDELSAVDRLRLLQLDGGSPPSVQQLLKDAVLELDERVTLMLENPAVVINSELKELDPREDKGTDHTAAPARVESEGSLPPAGSPAPSSRYGVEPYPGASIPNKDGRRDERAYRAYKAAKHSASLQTRPEHD